MTTKRVPGSVMRRRTPFPAGHFRGEIGEVADATNPDNTNGSAAFQLTGITAVEADVEPGTRPHFVNLLIWMDRTKPNGKTETYQVADVDPTDERLEKDGGPPFFCRNAMIQWTQLAAALGQATVEEDGGIEFTEDLETFIEQFRNGDYEGQEVEFIVRHRPEKKDGKVLKGGRTFTDTDFVVPEAGDADEAEAEEEDAEEEEVPEEVEEEEEKEAPKPKKGELLAKASARAVTTKASGKSKGSGKGKFVRRK
jgi:hypothetical protein